MYLAGSRTTNWSIGGHIKRSTGGPYKKSGTAEIGIKGKMLSRLSIFPPYQDNGYGTQIVNMLNEKYGCDVLWVNADNKRAIHVYEKNGYDISEATMYLMKRKEVQTVQKQNDTGNFEFALLLFMGMAVMVFIFMNGPW